MRHTQEMSYLIVTVFVICSMKISPECHTEDPHMIAETLVEKHAYGNILSRPASRPTKNLVH